MPGKGRGWKLAFFALGLGACSAEPERAGGTRPYFVEVGAAAGVRRPTRSGTPAKRYIVEANMGGAALFDFDNDGDLDIFVVNGSRLEGFASGQAPRAALYRNEGEWRFCEVGAAAGVDHRGWGMGAVAVDYNADGWVDLYLSCYGPNALYRNEGGGRFVDVAAQKGVDYAGWSSAAAFGDFDADGDLDFYLSNYLHFDPASAGGPCTWRGIEAFCGPLGLPGARDLLYRNEGPERGWSFVEAGRDFGLAPYEYYGLGVQAGDFDNDGDLDLYLADDSTPNVLYRNDGGRFRDVAPGAGVAYSGDGRVQAGMGIAGGDFDNDGDVDLFVTNFSHDNNTLYRNDGNSSFADISFAAELGRRSLPYLGWGAGFFDFDNDGDLDLFVANGHVYPTVDRSDLGTRYAQRNQLFENMGGGHFVEVSKVAGPGLQVERSSRGVALGDLDEDGDVDLVVVNMDHRPTLLRNEGGNARHWLSVRLRERGANTQAIGARVWLWAGGRRQLREVRAGTGYASQSDVRLHFGLGAAARADTLRIRWPRGEEEVLLDVEADRQIVVERGRGVVAAR